MSPMPPDDILKMAGLLAPQSKASAGLAVAPKPIQPPMAAPAEVVGPNGYVMGMPPPEIMAMVASGVQVVGGREARMAMFPDEFPESKTDKPNVVMRGVRGIAAGIADMAPSTMALAAGVIDFMGADEAGAQLGQKALDLSSWFNDHLAVENPTLYDHVMRGVGSMITFILPGIGAAGKAGQIAMKLGMVEKTAKGATVLSKAGQAFRALTGGGAMSFLEAAVEQSQREMELIGKGMTPEQAMKESAPVFWHNMGVLMATNTVAYFLPLPIKTKNEFVRRAAKAVEAAFTEGGQERAQAVIQAVASGEGEWGDFLDPKKNVTETLVGAIVGGGTAALLPGEPDAPQKSPSAPQQNAPAQTPQQPPKPATSQQAPAQAPQPAQPLSPAEAPAAPIPVPADLPMEPAEGFDVWTGQEEDVDEPGLTRTPAQMEAEQVAEAGPTQPEIDAEYERIAADARRTKPKPIRLKNGQVVQGVSQDEFDANRAASKQQAPVAESAPQYPAGTRPGTSGERVRDVSLPGGKTIEVDASIADVVGDLNNAGYRTSASMSGVEHDYRGTPAETRYSNDGYLAFPKEGMAPEQDAAIRSAAAEAGLVTSDREVYLAPSLNVRAGVTKGGKSRSQVLHEAWKATMLKMGITEDEYNRADAGEQTENLKGRRRSVVDPNETVGPVFNDREKDDEWMRLRTQEQQRIADEDGGWIDNTEAMRRWEKFRSILVSKSNRATPEPDISPEAPAPLRKVAGEAKRRAAERKAAAAAEAAAVNAEAARRMEAAKPAEPEVAPERVNKNEVVNEEYADPRAADEVASLERQVASVRQQIKDTENLIARERPPAFSSPYQHLEDLRKSNKATGFKLAAARRRLTGNLTDTERKAEDKRRKSNHVAKPVTVLTSNGPVDGMVIAPPAFGKVRVKLVTGETISAAPANVRARGEEPRAQQEIKSTTTVTEEKQEAPAAAGDPMWKRIKDAGGTMSVDNPGGDWLARTRADAEEQLAKNPVRGRAKGKRTGTIRHEAFPVSALIDLPGLRDEQDHIRQDNVDRLAADMGENGFNKDMTPMVAVGMDGKPYILEGNHRIRAAAKAGLNTIPIEIAYYAGGEQVSGPLSPESVLEILTEPAPSPPQEAPAAAAEDALPDGASQAARDTDARYRGDRWTVHQVDIAEITTRPEDMQNRDASASQRTIDSIANDYKDIQMQPISLWLDPQTGALVTIQGHSRTEGFKKRGEKKIPAFIFKGATFAEAKQAALEGNFMQDQGSVLDKVKALRMRVQSEKLNKKNTVAAARKMFGKDAPTMIALMHLNPEGRVIDALRQFAGADDVASNDLTKIAKWVGEVRARDPNITDAHEGEMFDYLRKQMGQPSARNEPEFIQYVENRVGGLGMFDYAKSLNLNNAASRTPAQANYDAELAEAKRVKREAEAVLKAKHAEFTAATKRDKFPITKEKMDELLVPYDKAVSDANKAVLELESRKNQINKSGGDEPGLFRMGRQRVLSWGTIRGENASTAVVTKKDGISPRRSYMVTHHPDGTWTLQTVNWEKTEPSGATVDTYEYGFKSRAAAQSRANEIEVEAASSEGAAYRLGRPSIANLNKAATARGLTPAVAQSPRDLLDEMVVRVAKMFGFKNVQFVSGLTDRNGQMAHGYYQPESDTVFLNVGSKEPMLTVLMHEVGHRMEREHPDLYGQLIQILNDPANVRTGGKEVYAKDAKARGYGEVGVEREWVADGLMEASSRPEFWNVLQEKNPSLAGKLIQMIVDAIKAIRTMFAASGASVDIYYNNFGPLVRQIANVAAQMQAREAEVARASRPASAQQSMFRVSKALRKIATWFSGTGTLEAVLSNAKGVHAVEYTPEIIAQYNKAYGTKYTARDVTEIDPLEVAKTGADHFHASPVCKNFSKAKRNRGSNDLDIASARAVVGVILKAGMPSITIENVVDYIGTEPYKMIVEALRAAGYTQRTVKVNAADYGGAQKRTRMIIQAVKDGELPQRPEKTGPSDWFAAIEDLLPTAEKSTVEAERVKGRGWNWEPNRIAKMVEKGELDASLPIITMGGSTDKVRAWSANAGGPAPTLKATMQEVVRIIMPDGTVYRATPRMMARLMGLPDSFQIPEEYGFAKKVLGNGIHGNITKAFIEPLVNGERGTTPDGTSDQIEMFRIAPIGNPLANEMRDKQDAAMKSSNQPMHGGWRAGWRHVYMLMVDKYTFTHVIVRDIVKMADPKLAKKFSLTKNPYIALRRFGSWMSAVEVALKHGVYSWDGETVLAPGLQQIIKKHGLADAIDSREFGMFYTAATLVSRKYSLQRRNIDFFGTDPTSDEYQAAEEEFLKWQKIYDDYGGAQSKWMPAVDDFTKYAYALIQRSYEAGVISEQEFINLTKTYSVYAPLFVIDSSKYDVDRGDQIGAGSAAHDMKRFDPTAVRMDPIDALIKQTYHMEFFTRRNDAAVKHADFIRRFRDKSKKGVTVLEGFGMRVKPKEDPIARRVQDLLEAAGLSKEDIEALGEEGKADLEREAKIYVTSRIQPDGVIAILRDGKVEYWQLSPDIYDSFMAATGPKASHPMMKFFSAQTSLLRAGAVLTPDFMARNQFRDFASAAIISQHLIRNPIDPFLVPVRILRGLSHAIKQDDVYLEFMLEAGYAQLTAQDQKGLRKSSEATTRDSRTRAQRVGQFAKNPAKYVLHSHPITILQEFGKLTENSSRIAVYEKTKADLLKMGWSEAEARVKAAMEARESSIDFARSGTYGQVINQIIPFFNAAVQGNDKAFRTFVTDSGGRGSAWLKATMLVTVPSVLLWALNHDDDWYKDQPVWLKNNFWLFSVDGGKTIHKLPKPFEIGLIYASLAERFLDWRVDKDPKAMREWSEAILKNVVAVNDKNPVASVGGLLGPMAGTMTEIVSNYDSFRGTPIVKGWLEEVVPREQYNASTSEFAKAMGGMAPGRGISPMMIDHFIRGSFGGLGAYAAQAASEVIMLARPELKAMKPSDKQVRTLVGAEVPDWIPVIRAFAAASPSGYTRQMNDFFEIYDRGREASKTLQAFKASGAPRDKFVSLYRRSGPDIATFKASQEVAEKLGQLSKRARFIESMPVEQMSRDEKRRQIDELTESRNLMVKKFLERYYEIDQKDLQRQIEASIPQLERAYGR